MKKKCFTVFLNEIFQIKKVLILKKKLYYLLISKIKQEIKKVTNGYLLLTCNVVFSILKREREPFPQFVPKRYTVGQNFYICE
jgi:hypothetical protein